MQTMIIRAQVGINIEGQIWSRVIKITGGKWSFSEKNNGK